MIVLLHGVPETADIWADVRAHLDEASIALQLPGFGCPRPDGFSATKDAYVDWILEELSQIEEPIDLVGHDWGGGFSVRIGQHYPDAVRSWVSDVAGIVHPSYVWHDFAQLWQTPGAGEAFFEDQAAGNPEDTAALLQGFGLDEKAALKLARMSDPVMGTCILDLYRSAVPNPGADWPDTYAKAMKPCLFMMPSDDPFTAAHLADDVATALGARAAKFASGHFWPLQVPAEGARIINEFVASVS
ncbi:MAG TPA: alpha/beta hydrolase [Acidimicrobiales bacterium]|nr:alpha/beta hydrolase [Acidimicrobiales bacterium]